MSKWQSMTQQERWEFNTKHGLSNHQEDGNVIDAAKYDLELIEDGLRLYKGALDWTIEPLKELGEIELVNRLLECKRTYGI